MTATRVRLAAVAALVAAAAVAGVLLLAGGADGQDDGALAWSGKIQVFQSGIATDKILAGRIENSSLREVNLDIEDAELRDASGGEVRFSVVFLQAFAHGLYPWSQRPDPLGDFERRRLGQILTLKPGQSAPVTLSWRVPKGGAEPETIDFGPAEIKLPDVPVQQQP